jgi:hypothetical protein
MFLESLTASRTHDTISRLRSNVVSYFLWHFVLNVLSRLRPQRKEKQGIKTEKEGHSRLLYLCWIVSLWEKRSREEPTALEGF